MKRSRKFLLTIGIVCLPAIIYFAYRQRPVRPKPWTQVTPRAESKSEVKIQPAVPLPQPAAPPQHEPPNKAAPSQPPISVASSPDIAASLRNLIAAGNLADLRWPDFGDRQEDVAGFYESRGYEPAWLANLEPTAAARSMIQALWHAADKGLDPEDYDGSRWSGRLSKLKPAKRAPAEEDAIHFDLALTICAMRYIDDLHQGRANPQHPEFRVDEPFQSYTLAEFLENEIIRASDVTAALDQVEPHHAAYQRLLQALQNYRKLAKQDSPEQLPIPNQPVSKEDLYPALPRLAQLLKELGDLPPQAVLPNSEIYEGPLLDGVKHFQQRHGLEPDGKLTPQTVSALNVPLSQRVGQIELALERWRWLPSSFSAPPILVNLPAFELRAFDDRGEDALRMKVVVGKAYDHSTPIFSDLLQYVVFRPTWNVPNSIAARELLPKNAKHPGYLAKHGFQVVNLRNQVVGSGRLSSAAIHEIEDGKLTLRQKPGPADALGLVKFIFPNHYDVYFHDTPEKQLFARTRRDLSHGCIRLEKPVDLALWVLRNNHGWDRERIEKAMRSGETQWVKLAQPIPVVIYYSTAVAAEDGEVYFLDDIYDADAGLAQAMKAGYPNREASKSQDS